MQVKGENFLVPIGAQPREEYEVKRQCLPMAQVLDAMAEAESNLKVVVLDCCRDNPSNAVGAGRRRERLGQRFQRTGGHDHRLCDLARPYGG